MSQEIVRVVKPRVKSASLCTLPLACFVTAIALIAIAAPRHDALAEVPAVIGDVLFEVEVAIEEVAANEFAVELAEFDEIELVVVEAVAKEVLLVEVAQVAFALGDTQFDQWVFGNSQTASKGRLRLEAMLKTKIANVDSVCQLSAAQKMKLRLAGRGDIKRFFDDYATARKTFEKHRNDQQQINAIWQAAQPLQQRVNAGIFNTTSLTHKVVERTLNDEQLAIYSKREDERRQFRNRAHLALAMQMIEGAMPMRDTQRQALFELLLEEVSLPDRRTPYIYYLVVMQAEKLPPEKLQAILDESQLGLLKRQFKMAQRMKPALKQAGLIEE